MFFSAGVTSVSCSQDLFGFDDVTRAIAQHVMSVLMATELDQSPSWVDNKLDKKARTDPERLHIANMHLLRLQEQRVIVARTGTHELHE